MLIDWFTVMAQIVNFLILLWLLQRFLYRPILDAIDSREQSIASRIAAADAKKEEAQKELDTFLQKNEAFAAERTALLDQALHEAKTERQRILDEAKTEFDAKRLEALTALESEASDLNQAIDRRTRQEVFAIARQALSSMADMTLEERMVEVFLRRLRSLEEQTKNTLAQALASAPDKAVLRSAFELPAGERQAVQQALEEISGAQLSIRFETAPELLSGIELAAAGQKLAWSIADYLDSLEKGVDELLKRKQKVMRKKSA